MYLQLAKSLSALLSISTLAVSLPLNETGIESFFLEKRGWPALTCDPTISTPPPPLPNRCAIGYMADSTPGNLVGMSIIDHNCQQGGYQMVPVGKIGDVVTFNGFPPAASSSYGPFTFTWSVTDPMAGSPNTLPLAMTNPPGKVNWHTCIQYTAAQLSGYPGQYCYGYFDCVKTS